MDRKLDLSVANYGSTRDELYALAVLPWGATEPHNLHLPYLTDAILSHDVAVDAARIAKDMYGFNVMVMPPMPLGAQNPGQRDLKFCVHYRQSTQMAVLTDIVASLHNQGIDKLVIINGHGGNTFKGLIRDLAVDYPDMTIAASDWFKVLPAKQFFDNPGDHADELETSVMMHYHPELVNIEEAGEGDYTGFAAKSLAEGVAWIPRNWNKVSTDTGIGNPALATAEKGKAFAEAIAVKYAELFNDLVNGKSISRIDYRIFFNNLFHNIMVNRFILNEVSYFGPGARKELPAIVERLGKKKALVVTDKGLIKFGVAKMVTDVLDEAGIPYDVFSEVKPNPTVQNVKDGIEAFKASGADFIIAIGGGSSMDTAKGIGIVINNPEFSDIVSLEGCAPTKNKSVPIVALPTTAGTAAETTINYVIIDEEKHKKMVCVDPNDIPAVAVIDAELMYSLPKGLTAATGMDALTHAIEGYITRGAWEMSDMFEIEAIRMISKYLPIAVSEPTNPEGRNGMALAQYIAGMAFSNVGLGLVHGMAHPMGSLFDVPHGVANALLLPTIMEFNKPACLDKYPAIAQAMGVDTAGMSKEEASQAAVEAVRKLSLEVGIPQTLNELGISEKDIPALAEQALADVCTPGNPRDVTLDDIVSLYKKCL